MLTTTLKLADKYNYLEEKFNIAFNFLKNENLMELPLGKVLIKGDDIFANVQEYTTMPASDCKYEAHDKYFDIQYVVKGKEQFGYALRHGMETQAPYDADNDLVFFKEPSSGGSILLSTGDFAVVAPEDAHKPRCIDNEPCEVRKIVVKVRV
ncbi:YhcH/YjgK/YiaL family protein [[Clostridium] fimetarium]|uniref:YhcH/YjgK/YiaL family protein n=1 Tax=[Clostridium] fimetarium TaxID=99656 RepID=A0A1I0NR84_9FIRM|nr:YhcH/YjgK/YiaL family protein [[Clostridium] fimetarium]SEW04083.1 YhcH/YjgK/YiaL family protein [[Clostridium] fimetarium]